MMSRLAFAVAAAIPVMVLVDPSSLLAGGDVPQTAEVPRAIRRDVPLTNAIRRALDAGTRDLTGAPGPRYWQLRTDYLIRVRLDPATAMLTGNETITIHNTSPEPLEDLYLRLDHNIFRGLVPRGASVPAENTEGMIVTAIRMDGQPVLLAPTAGRGRGAGAARQAVASGLDQTLARIVLAAPIAAGATGALDVEWRTTLPGGAGGRGHRMTQRFDHTLFQPTQWYPRLAKFDDLRGWDTNVYLGPAEFYNNFGRFDVRIDVPGGWIVSGTGVLQNPEAVLTSQARQRLAQALTTDEEVMVVGDDERGPGQATAPGDRLVWHFVADVVNDFAWATAEKFNWRATRATVPGRGSIPIHMVYEPRRANQFATAGRITRHALEFYSRILTPYPFPQLTLQDGPSAGMEYPMVINSNQGAADHETAHQWWPMMVGNNETWYGWMDEGFNQYVNLLSTADVRNSQPRLNTEGQRYGLISGNESEPPMMWNANYGGPMYGFQTYQKTPMMLSMLGGIVGDDRVIRGLSAFTRAWAFKHPSPWDFMSFMNRELGQDLNWFWYAWLWTTESVDGAIERVTTRGTQTVVTVRQRGQMPAPIVLRVHFSATGPAIRPMPNARIEGDSALVMWPVETWFDGRRTFDAVLDFGGRTIERIQLDPACRFPDRDPLDNTWPAPAAGAPPSPPDCRG
jgi:hypothetical protein